MTWQQVDHGEVLRPETPWEGANAPLVLSMRSTAYGVVNELRDPALLLDEGRIYLFYAVAGESGIAVAEITLGLLQARQGAWHTKSTGRRPVNTVP